MYRFLPGDCILLLSVSLPRYGFPQGKLTRYSETRHKTLEEIAAAFGDKVVTLTERDLAVEQTVFEGKAATRHIESAGEDDK